MNSYGKFLLIFLGLTLSQRGLCQIYVGGKGGLTFSTLNLAEHRSDLFNPRINDEAKLGFTGGAVVQFFAQPHAGLQAELNFVQKGWTELLDTINTFSTTLNYIELPVMTHLSLGKGKTGWFLNVGPSIGLLLSYSESDFDPELEDLISYRMTEGNRKNFSVGIQGGAGINRLTPIGHLQFDFTYSLSFSNIFSNPRGVGVPDQSLPSYMGLTIGWLKQVKE